MTLEHEELTEVVQADNFTSTEILEALTEIEKGIQHPTANNLTENGLELRELGFRDINDANIDEAAIMTEMMKTIQVQRTLEDYARHSKDKRSTYDYLDQHAEFLSKLSPGKTKADIVKKMTVEQAAAVMKITAKADIPEKLLKKHLTTLKHKYA